MQTEIHSIDLDEILPKIGGFGKYQILILLFVTFPAMLPTAMTAYNQIFMNDVPSHWCQVPELEFLTKEQRRNLAIPQDGNKTWNSCYRYAMNWTQILREQNIDQTVPNTSWPIEYCPQGFEYNETSSSLATEFDLVCDYSIYPMMGLFILNGGNMIGIYIYGYLNDKYGRRPTYFICLTNMLIGSIITAISPNFRLWAIGRFITGHSISGWYQIAFIASIELVAPKHRSLVTAIAVLYSTAGLLILCGLAYLLPNWVHLTLATSLPFALYYLYWFLLPESPRWLLTQGRYEEAIKILKTIARVNKKTIPEGLSNILKQEIDSQQSLLNRSSKRNKSPNIIALFRTPIMRLNTILLCFISFVNMVTYSGLNICAPGLGSNPFLSFALSVLVEIPSYFFMHFTIDRWGRRWPFALAMIVSGLSAIATGLLQEDSTTSILILYLISKCAISASFALLYLFAGEIFPTELRGLGLGTAAIVGNIGPAVVPFINYLGQENLVIPLIIMGVLSLTGGVVSLKLPETMSRSLPQTLEEAEQLGKNSNTKKCCNCIFGFSHPLENSRAVARREI